MPQPTSYDVHVDAPLTNISVAYIQSQDNFIASKVFPIVPVTKASNKYYVFTKNDWFRDEAQRRADTDESAGSGYNLTTDSYSCDVWAFHKDVGDKTRANADNPIDLDRGATEFVTQRLLLRQEVQWASDFFTTGIWGTDVVGNTDFNKWSNYASSDPIGDIETGKQTILGNTGFMPNMLVLGYAVFRYLKHHPDLVDRMKYTTSKVITEDILAQLFGVGTVLVAKAVKATNNEGATAVYAFTHASSAMLAYVNPSPGLLQPSAGYIFAWNGVSGGLGENIGVSRIRMEARKADRVEGEIAFADKVVATDLGYFFSAAA
jgi:hypothetical protein